MGFVFLLQAVTKAAFNYVFCWEMMINLNNAYIDVLSSVILYL